MVFAKSEVDVRGAEHEGIIVDPEKSDPRKKRP